MVRVAFISAALLGTTVLGGMGLSYAHGVFYVDPVPVRAEVVTAQPVVSYAKPVLTRAPSVRSVAQSSFDDTQAVKVARIAPVPEQPKPAQDVVATPVALDDGDGFAQPIGTIVYDSAPLASRRPQMRKVPAPAKAETDSSRLVAAAPRTIRPAKEPAVQRSRLRLLRTARVERAEPKQTPRFLIGVYR
jgi:hypothetical protein